MEKILPYRLLDSGNCRKLEQTGPYRIIRPALNAFWKPALPQAEWNAADAEFRRESSGGGVWNWKRRHAEEWLTSWGGLTLLSRPTNFGHLGFFAEQAPNWDWMRSCVSRIPGRARTLNMFAYSGGATLAMAEAGAEACHLDASKGIIEWAKKNQSLNPKTKDRVRWICDDALKFAAREARRGSHYHGIALDPPSFGRGAQGQVWKIEDGLEKLLLDCRSILNLKEPHFIILSCHSQGFSPVSLGRCLAAVFPESANRIECGEMLIPEADGSRHLPAGMFARFFAEQ